jgi:hypothetical protein
VRTFRAGNQPTLELRKLANDIEKAANRADDRVALQYLSTAPERPSDGLYLSAAGVLGVTRGLYRYDSASGTYVFIA